jgi:hypothetical protein
MVTMSVGWEPGDLPTPRLKQAQAYWYQWFMATERGRQMVRRNGKAFARIQWDTWSPPGWFSDADFERARSGFLPAVMRDMSFPMWAIFRPAKPPMPSTSW